MHTHGDPYCDNAYAFKQRTTLEASPANTPIQSRVDTRWLHSSNTRTEQSETSIYVYIYVQRVPDVVYVNCTSASV